MNNKVKTEIEQIEIPSELHHRSKNGIQKAKEEMRPKKTRYWSKVASAVASMIILASGYVAYQNINDGNSQVSPPSSAIQVPVIVPPDGVIENSDMFNLIVHDGKVYTQSNTSMDSRYAEQVRGRKLGTTKGIINEWSKQDEYAKELASTTSGEDVYTVKGYDEDFRIMTYTQDGDDDFRFYEHLNGITVKEGSDIFGKLKLTGNVVSADYRLAKDWDNNVDAYHVIDNNHIVDTFVKELNYSTPFLRESIEGNIDAAYKNDEIKELSLHLKDGSRVRLIIMQNGYIHYGLWGETIYFRMDGKIFKQMWNELNPS